MGRKYKIKEKKKKECNLQYLEVPICKQEGWKNRVEIDVKG